MGWLSKIRKWNSDKELLKTKKEAEERYQVREFEGELWFTVNGGLVCPCDYFKNDPVETVCNIQKLYVDRNKIQE